MNATASQTGPESGRVRIGRNISFMPRHIDLLDEEALRRARAAGLSKPNVSDVIQDLIDEGLGDKPTGKFCKEVGHLDLDCQHLLQAAGYSVQRRGAVKGHVVDLVANSGKKKPVLVLLCPNPRADRLEPMLGRALMLKHEAGQPVVVCAPYLLDPSFRQAFKLGGVALCTPEGLVKSVKDAK